MQQTLDHLDYRNVERVWIAPIARDDEAAASSFELHVVRTNEDGAAYEDGLATLSKSEREVVGLVFGLAGYLVHDVAETVPVVVVDVIEMLDADRIEALLSFFADHADYVVAAVLPEEAADLADAYDRVPVLPAGSPGS